MTRRKREMTGLSNERDFPHLVELALPTKDSRSVLLIHAVQGLKPFRQLSH
jgi:hypothetical protein